MKIKLLFTVVLLMFSFSEIFAQGTWVQKASLTGTGRNDAVAFSIGTEGYIGTGFTGTVNLNDFWQWNQASNTWTQKADFGGTPRRGAVGFSIGTKGYIGTGFDINSQLTTDFWEYDPAANTWSKKSYFGGNGRQLAVGFSIGSKGYIGTGTGASPLLLNDFWEYDQASDTWTQKADFGGSGRYCAIGFSIGTEGYIGTGWDSTFAAGNITNDFWQWDQASNTWSQKADFGGAARQSAVGFSIGATGYICAGYTDFWIYDMWAYDQASDAWTQKASYPGLGAYGDIAFSIGDTAYVGTGQYTAREKDFWAYAPDTLLSVGITPLSGACPDCFGGEGLGVRLFPNPFPHKGVINISLGENSKDAKVIIYNVTGEKIYSHSFNGNACSLSFGEGWGEASGIYFIEVREGEKKYTSKIVLQ